MPDTWYWVLNLVENDGFIRDTRLVTKKWERCEELAENLLVKARHERPESSWEVEILDMAVTHRTVITPVDIVNSWR